MSVIYAQVNIGETFGSPWGAEGGLLFGDLFSLILSGGIVVGSVITVILFVMGGLHMVHGAGSGDPKASAQGKEAITWALLGFAITFSAYWLSLIHI